MKDNKNKYFEFLRSKYGINDIKIFMFFKNYDFLRYAQDKYQFTREIFSDTMLMEFRKHLESEKDKLYNGQIKGWLQLPTYEQKKQSNILSDKIGISKQPRNFKPFLDIFVQYVKQYWPQKIELSNQLLDISNLTQYHEQYPFTREIKRKFIFHYGPTNSGKTYEAIKKLSQSKNGLYCAPLRLLAWEVQQKLEEFDEVQCDLITGQEKIITEGSQVTSCTVEMASAMFVNQSNEIYDCAVLDEIQLIGDFERGSAWTNIVLGLPAREIHVCGDPKAMNIIKKLVKLCEDDFEMIEYNRLSKLTVSDQLFKYSDIQPGDCLIGFSVQSLFRIKQEILKHKQDEDVAILYGRLPPQVRRQQAQNFNEGKAKYLVATDVLGMGLNFLIKRIIFTELKPITRGGNENSFNSQYVQIGGRAGRGGMEGTIMCTNTQVLYKIQKVFDQSNSFYQYLIDRKIPDVYKNYSEIQIQKFKNIFKQIRRATIFPSPSQVKDFKKELEKDSDIEYKLSEVILKFVQTCQLEGSLFFIQKHLDFRKQADLLQDLNLPLDMHFQFSLAPLNQHSRSNIPSQYLKLFAQQQLTEQIVFLPNLLENKQYNEYNQDFSYYDSKKRQQDITEQQIQLQVSINGLQKLQDYFHVIELYIWLHHKYPQIYVDLEKALSKQQDIINEIDEILKDIK